MSDEEIISAVQKALRVSPDCTCTCPRCEEVREHGELIHGELSDTIQIDDWNGTTTGRITTTGNVLWSSGVTTTGNATGYARTDHQHVGILTIPANTITAGNTVSLTGGFTLNDVYTTLTTETK